MAVARTRPPSAHSPAALGDSQAEIAKRLGKSRQWVTLTTAMIEPPDWLLDLYRQGRCRGMLELYELRRLHGEHPRHVEAWASSKGSISRDAVAALRAELSGAMPGSPAATRTRPQMKYSRLHVQMDGKEYQLVVSIAPEESGHLYVRPLEGGPRLLAPAAALTLCGFVSG